MFSLDSGSVNICHSARLVLPPSKEVSILVVGFLINYTTDVPGGPFPEGGCSASWSTVSTTNGPSELSSGLEMPLLYFLKAHTNLRRNSAMHHSADALKHHFSPPPISSKRVLLPSADLVMGPSWTILNIL